MKSVPYHANRGNACALACYTMVAQYLLPGKHVTFEDLARITDWQKGYVVWGFAVWRWLMDNGVYITDYDVIDYEAWARDGIRGLQASVTPKEFAYYKENTYDLATEAKRINLAYKHPHFTYIRHSPSWDDIVVEYNKPGICDVTLNACYLNRQEGFDGHRVVIVEINNQDVVFHDPNSDGSGAYRHEIISHFRKAVADFGAPELARYSLE